ncbi:MAG TPA: bifunctional hydroxymethylpyrimidine kinase/phosphomethylpyrimidine kinase [Xanthomonadales bacterium]|nr:bifunctional hydroxymethylpyrimidine kinase/phosphomethylpyrimidine kinase [Xanthomonadales bacterium]
MRQPVSALTIAGSDSGGGAGIQADLRTFAAYGVHGLSAIAATTAQNTRAVTGVHRVPGPHLAAQIAAVFADFRVGAVKTGMLGTAATVRCVARSLAGRSVPFVLDPVMIASSGAALLAPGAVRAVLDSLVPIATLVTPNVPEAERLTGVRISDARGVDAACDALLALGARAVLLKGGHVPGRVVVDVLRTRDARVAIRHARLAREGHGTGCTLASAIAAQLAMRVPLADAVRDAVDYVHGALRDGYRPGRGPLTVLDHLWRMRPR